MDEHLERLRAFMIRSSSKEPSSETIGLARTTDDKVYAYSEFDFDIWFKIGDQWIKASTDSQVGGVKMHWPEGSTEVFFQHTRPNQLILGFKDLSLEFEGGGVW